MKKEMFTGSINYIIVVQFCGKVWFMSNIIGAANVGSFSPLKELSFNFFTYIRRQNSNSVS